jgi:hypothetical protein
MRVICRRTRQDASKSATSSHQMQQSPNRHPCKCQ